MSIQLAKRPITVDEYYRMAEVGILTENDKVELIQGEIIKMSPIGSKHAAFVNRFTNILKEHLGNRAIVSVQNPVRINDLNEPEPDVSILRPVEDYYAEKHPTPKDVYIVIEISDTTLAYDREIKLPLYASAGIPEFWLVNTEKKEIEIHRTPSVDIYKNIEIVRTNDQVILSDFNLKIDASVLLG